VIRRVKFALFALVFVMLLPLTVAPAMAAGPSSPPTPPSPLVTSGTLAELQALIASLPEPTPEQLAIAQDFLANHPLQGTVTVDTTSPAGPVRIGPRPDVSVGVDWNGITLHFTKEDVHNIWDLVWAAGVGAAATILCAPGGWVAVACAIAGAVIAYIVAEVIWYYIGYYVPDCGVHIFIPWTYSWSWGYC